MLDTPSPTAFGLIYEGAIGQARLTTSLWDALLLAIHRFYCNVNIVYGNLKSENCQDYAQKPQQNCKFMNSASGNLGRGPEYLLSDGPLDLE